MASDAYTRARIGQVVLNAVAAARARQQGHESIQLGQGQTAQTLDLVQGGMCNRFVRQCYETGMALGAQSWRYRAGTANGTLGKLQAQGHGIAARKAAELLPGDILGIRGGLYGHIMLYVGTLNGTPTVAENTSAGNRGNPRSPGTKLTALSDVIGRVNGVYRLLRKSDWEPAEKRAAAPEHRWRCTLVPDATDIVASGRATTWSDHVTRTGVAADTPGLIACSLPRGLCEETRGAPFGGVPDWALVRIYYPRTGKSVVAPVIDEGPAYSATAGTGLPGSAMIDLTPAAWIALGGKPNVNDEVVIRVLKGTEGIVPAWRKG